MGWSDLKRDMGFALGIMRKRPFQVLLQITNRCNMKCDFCDFWPNGAPESQELTLDDFRRLERQLAGFGRFLVSIEGGEPFVRRDLIDVVRILSRRHISALFTNGWYVGAENAHALFDAGLAQVGVSIDYPDAKRHDRKRGLEGTFERAWRAVDHFRDAAPHGGRQVHVMTVLMEDNWRDLEPLLQLSAQHGVGHCLTLISNGGFRRATGGEVPAQPVSEHLLGLWKTYPHFRIFREYLEKTDTFLEGGELPQCRAGIQSFNIDHLGNVSPCIEKIDTMIGNIRDEPLAAIHGRMAALDEVKTCQDCWTACRGFNQIMGSGGNVRGWSDLAGRMRSA